jgi:hypothetical protein
MVTVTLLGRLGMPAKSCALAPLLAPAANCSVTSTEPMVPLVRSMVKVKAVVPLSPSTCVTLVEDDATRTSWD